MLINRMTIIVKYKMLDTVIKHKKNDSKLSTRKYPMLKQLTTAYGLL